MALTKDRNTEMMDLDGCLVAPVGVVKVIKGGLLVLDGAGFARDGYAATGLTALGVAQETVDNSAGAAGDLNVRYKVGVFKFDNKSGDALSKIGQAAYIDDDATVCATATSKSQAGKVVQIDDDGAWIYVGVI